jgi:hypothetical protein
MLRLYVRCVSTTIDQVIATSRVYSYNYLITIPL